MVVELGKKKCSGHTVTPPSTTNVNPPLVHGVARREVPIVTTTTMNTAVRTIEFTVKTPGPDSTLGAEGVKNY